MEVHKGWIRYTELRDKDEPNFGVELAEKHKDLADQTHTARDQAREELKDFVDEVIKCVENGKKHFDGDFFVEVLFVHDRILQGVTKRIFAARRTCPHPFHDQAAYKYHADDENIEFMWVVPGVETSKHLRLNVLQLTDNEKFLYDNLEKYTNLAFAKRKYLEDIKIAKKNNKIIKTG